MVAILAKFALDRAARRWDAMEADLKSLREEKIAGLAARVADVERTQRECRIPTLLERIDNLIGWTRKIDSKLDAIATAEARTEAAVEAQKTWIANLDASHQAHLRDRGQHHG